MFRFQTNQKNIKYAASTAIIVIKCLSNWDSPRWKDRQPAWIICAKIKGAWKILSQGRFHCSSPSQIVPIFHKEIARYLLVRNLVQTDSINKHIMTTTLYLIQDFLLFHEYGCQCLWARWSKSCVLLLCCYSHLLLDNFGYGVI